MMVLDVIRFALHGVAANKLRSMLTVLGISIGVGSVIIVVAYGNGSAQAVQASIASLGTTTLTVSQANQSFGGPGRTAASSTLTVADAEALTGSDDAPDVDSAAPVVSTSATLAWSGTSVSAGQFVGTTPAYLDASGYSVATGSMLTQDDIDRSRKVALIGQTTAENLFGTASPVGELVLVNGVPFTIAGELASIGSSGFTDGDDIVIAPYTTVQASLTGYGTISQILVQATGADTVDAATAEVTAILSLQHGIAAGEDADFTVSSASNLLDATAETSDTFTVLLAAIAAVSLLVGGIGVTNIMLVTVTERTREIGLRKALGAPRWAVLGQFLAEAIFLTLVGGGLGVAGGLIASTFTISGVEPVVVPASVGLAFGVCVAIGLFFGGYPAGRAAGLRPVEALRHE